MKKRIHRRPEYLKTKPYYLVRIPWGSTTGDPACPCQYYNGLQAAVHSLLSAMQCTEMDSIQIWMKTARRQLSGAIRQSAKPGAMVPVVGESYDRPDDQAD
jgi:hypothetical protein